ncbi:hypothetical protein HA466_0191150 [Hirschfeldia incana]|nr:hypothetical protein HA466_0191150 [Hirschfeldia incana]
MGESGDCHFGKIGGSDWDVGMIGKAEGRNICGAFRIQTRSIDSLWVKFRDDAIVWSMWLFRVSVALDRVSKEYNATNNGGLNCRR